MQTQPTVLLQHVTRVGRHYDWLVGDPSAEAGGRLWTARLALPSGQWQAAGRLTLMELPPHRRAYLHHQGPVSGGRGVVRRVDAGTVRPVLWTATRRVLAVRMRYYQGLAELRWLAGERWSAVVTPGGDGGRNGKSFAERPVVLL
ncbi:MAG: hypothetical protein WD534_12305 [Phycisphaeraceae bacterium]